MNTTGITADKACRLHETGIGHPEAAERLDAILGALDDAGLVEQAKKIVARDATMAELRLCHTSAYLDLAQYEIQNHADQLRTGDTAISEQSWDAAIRAAGSVLAAVDAVFAGEVKNAYCVGRPPGHHATPDRGMGFCIVNNIAIAARYAQQKHDVKRVLIADWDVHHGNGTQDIFYEDGSVFVFNTHQSPWYPGTGAATETGKGSGKGATMNCPFPAGAGRKEILGAFREKLVPAMDEFRPELVLISAGFDSRVHDPLGHFTLHDEDFAALTTLLLGVAEKYAAGRVVSSLEGGYSLTGLGSASVAHVRALMRVQGSARSS